MTFSIFTCSLLLLIFDCFNVRANLIPAARLNEIADKVNSMQTTWTAGVINNANFEGVSVADTLGIILPEGKLKVSANYKEDDENSDDVKTNCENNGLPSSFDAREQWPNCKSISHIADQGNCGSCWAVSAVTSFADRVCISSKGKINSLRSSEQQLSCTYPKKRDGCQGGWPMEAFEYMKEHGLVTGGDYHSKEGCQPYLHKPCNHHTNSTRYKPCPKDNIEKSKSCKKKCYNRKYTAVFKDDLVKAKSIYEVDPCSAMNEIYKNGPIVAAFAVYEDFYTYKSGVYQYTAGKLTGFHAVRVIGWGEEKNIPYWLATNSWNEDWGDKGTLKILRNDNNCWFEESFSAALPQV